MHLQESFFLTFSTLLVSIFIRSSVLVVTPWISSINTTCMYSHKKDHVSLRISLDPFQLLNFSACNIEKLGIYRPGKEVPLIKQNTKRKHEFRDSVYIKVSRRPCTTRTCRDDPIPYKSGTLFYHYAPVFRPAYQAPSVAVFVEPWIAHPGPCPDRLLSAAAQL